MVCTTSGATRYISRDFWFLWLGFDKTPIPKIASTQLPCLIHTHVGTGEAGVVDTPGIAPCGDGRYCVNCEQLFQMLGQAWHVRSMTDVAVAWLDKIADRHCKGDASVEWFVRPEEAPHSCGPQCEHNPRPGL